MGATATHEPAPQRARNLALDGLRGWAAVAVVVYHSIFYFDESLIARVAVAPLRQVSGWYDRLAKLILAVWNGQTAVVLFFVLSGAVLFDSLHAQAEQGAPRLALGFALRRVTRLAPALVACLVASYALFGLLAHLTPGTFKTFTPAQLKDNLLLRAFAVQGATWTLKVELLAVPFVWLAFWADRRFGLLALWLVVVASVLAFDNPWMVGGTLFLPESLFCFGFGFLLTTAPAGAFFQRLGRHAWVPVLGALLAVRHVVGSAPRSGALAQAALAAVLVGLVHHRRVPALEAWLERPLSRTLGRLSYSLYLFNVPVMNVLLRLIYRRLLPNPERYALPLGLLGGAAIVALTLPIAVVTERFLERPFIRLGHRLSGVGRRV